MASALMLRQTVRGFLGVALAFSLILDGWLGEAAISGYGDVGYLDERGLWTIPGPDSRLWLPIVVFILLQGILVLALIRTRKGELSRQVKLSE